MARPNLNNASIWLHQLKALFEIILRQRTGSPHTLIETCSERQMARPNLIICSVTCSAQSNYRNYATPKVRRSSHSIFSGGNGLQY